MNLKTLLKAAFKIKNIALLSFILIVFYLTYDNPFSKPFLLIGAAGYIYFIMQTLEDENFKRELSEEAKKNSIQKLNEECNRLYSSMSRRVPDVMYKKIQNIINEKDDLISFYHQNRSDQLRQKIIEQALKLVAAYIKLVYDHSTRIRELETIKVGKVTERINNNSRKLDFVKNQNARDNLQRAIELDKRLLERINAERSEVEMISTKLDYIESAILMFKHQIVSSDSEDPLEEDIDNVVNEAEALDNVLTQKKNGRLKL